MASDKLSPMSLAENRLSLFARPATEPNPIKHSLTTAFRQLRCVWETRLHRYGRKSPPPTDKLPCGLIGAGSFFHYAYLPALNRKNSPLLISGILARNETTFRAAQRDLRYPVRRFPSLDAIREAGANSVLILAPNHLHFDYARQALATGLNVFCEKPLAHNVADALELKSIAQQTGRVLMVDFNQRYLDRNRVLKRVIAESRIGKITSVRAYHNQNLAGQPHALTRLPKNVTGGGAVHNAGIHFINLFHHWFGAVDRVHAIFENRALPLECGEDTAFCRFWFRNGVTATLEASLANAVATTYERVHFIGEQGEITSDLKKGDIQCQPGGNQRLKIDCKKEVISDSVFTALQRFERCVATGTRPETDVNDFIETMKVVEALTLSAQRGADVQLDELERNYAG